MNEFPLAPIKVKRLPKKYADAPPIVLEGSASVVRAFLEGKNINTLDAYQRDLMDFCDFLHISRDGRYDGDAAAKAVAEVFSKDTGTAHNIVLSYRNALLKDKKSPKTVNRRLSTLRAMGKIARLLGQCHFMLEVPNVPDELVRDTRGPGEDGVKRMLAVLRNRYNKGTNDEKRKALRDCAILRLLYDLALRRMEVSQLNLGSIDLTKRIVVVRRKRRARPQPLTLPRNTCIALKKWINARGAGEPESPLFIPLGVIPINKRIADRLGDQSIYLVIKKIGKDAGLKTWPHALRHAAITAALDGGADIRAVSRFSGHKNPATLMIYDDNRKDLGGDVAKDISKRLL